MTGASILRAYAERSPWEGQTREEQEAIIRDLVADPTLSKEVAAEVENIAKGGGPSADLTLFLEGCDKLSSHLVDTLIDNKWWVSLKGAGIPEHLQERALEMAKVSERSWSAFAEMAHLAESVQLLCAKGPEWVRTGLAQNPSLHPSVQKILAKDASQHVVLCLAGSAVLTFEVMTLLAKHHYYRVREAIASQAGVPESVLEYLAGDEYAPVLTAVAKTTTSSQILEKIVKGSAPGNTFMSAVVANPHVPLHLVEHVVTDTLEEMRTYEEDEGDEYEPPVLSAALSNELWKEQVREMLFAADVRCGHRVLARDEDTPSLILEGYARSADTILRHLAFLNPALEWNPSLPPHPLDGCSWLFLQAVRDGAGVDAEMWDSLWRDWAGTYTDLVDACKLVLRS